jgi:hypothetical protein
MTTTEIARKLRTSSSFYKQTQAFIQESKIIPVIAIDEPKKPKLVQNRNNRHQKNRLLKSARNVTSARSSLFSIYCRTHRFSTNVLTDNTNTLNNSLNLENFKRMFFSEKHPTSYERLQTLPKLLICQYILHRQSDSTLKPYAFTFRLPTHLHDSNTQTLNKKIQRKLTAALDRPVQFWMVRETDGNDYDKTLTHYHGEILINPTGLIEYRKIIKAFMELFNAKHKPIQAGDDTIMKNPMPRKAIIDFHISSRNSNKANYGEIYGIMNWPSYATKQIAERLLNFKRRCFDCQLQKKPYPPKENQKFHYISSALNKQASSFYNSEIK